MQVIFAVTDLAVSLDFYERALGWPRNGRIDYANYVELLAPDGGALGLYERAGFEQTVGAPPAEIPEGRVAPAYLYVRVDDVGPTVETDRVGRRAGAQPAGAPRLGRERRLVRGPGRQRPRGRARRWAHGSLNSPRATTTADPPTSTDSISPPAPAARA